MNPTDPSHGGDGGAQSFEMSVLGETIGTSDITPRRTRTRRKLTDTETLSLQSQSLAVTTSRRRRRPSGVLPHLLPSPTRGHHVETLPEEEVVIKELDPDKRQKLKALYGDVGLPTNELHQSWMDSVPKDELESLRNSFADVDPISFFAGVHDHTGSSSDPDALRNDIGAVGPSSSASATRTPETNTEANDEDRTTAVQPDKNEHLEHIRQPLSALCVITRAQYEGSQRAVEGERGVVRYNPILAPRENLPERDTIDLVEEGFFVGIPPAVPNHRLRSTERRLRNATTMRRESVSNILGESSTDASNNADINDDGGWFEADGRLKQLADPLVPYPQRLPLTGAHAQLVGHHRALDTRIQFHGAITSDPSSVARPNLYTLDISVSSVVFTDHELYLQEHRLARQLEGLVDHDRKRSDDKPAELLTHKLAALRRAKAKAEENLRNSGRMTMGPDQLASTTGFSQAEASNQRLRERCESYRKEICETRAARDAEIIKDLSIKESIVKTWNQLKAVRVHQQFASTPHQIRVFQEPTDEVDDRAQMTADLKHELEELHEEYEITMAERRHAHREAVALQVQRLRIENADPNEIAQIDLEGVPPELNVPFDTKRHRKRIAARLQSTRRPPGTPLIMVTLTLSGAVTSDADCPRAERWRRDHVRHWRVRVLVSVNGRTATRTRSIPLAQDFTADVREEFHIQLHEAPREVLLDVVQCGGGGRARHGGQLAQVYAPVPTQGLATPTDEQDLVFSCPHRTRHEETGGGGVLRDGADDDDDDAVTAVAGDGPDRIFHTSGVLVCTLQWAPSDTASREAAYHDEVGGGDGPEDRFHANGGGASESDAVGMLGAGGIRDVKLLRKWLRDARIDPRDPTNAYLLRHVRDDRTAGGDMRIKYYRLCSDAGAELNADDAIGAVASTHKRERLLELRHKEVPGFNDEVVPLHEDEIAEDVFKKLERKTHVAGAAEEKGLNEPEWRRSAQAQFLKEIREKQMAKQQQLRSRRALQDVVHDHLFPSHTSSFIAALKGLFGGQGVRPLRPRSRPVKKLAAVHTPERCDVIIRIARAWGLPHRVRAADGAGGAGRVEAPGRATSPLRGLRASGRVEHKDPVLLNVTDVELRPFVEVAFQSEIQSTSTVTGTSPSWNEEIILPFTPPGNNYSPESLLACEDCIFFHVYDQVYVDILEDEGKRHTDIHKRRERRWLGNFSVPIATVYTNQQVDGTFRIDVPFALLGYAPSVKQGVAVPSYISVFITVAPQLQTALKNITTTDSYEDDELLNYAELWRDAVAKKRLNADVNPLTQDMYGLSVLITRYVHPQIPPLSVVDPGHVTPDTTFVSMRRLARFVAMIPERNDSSLFVGHADLWTTSAQMLQMMGADEEEHALLLCNYFLTLPDVDAYVVVGKGIPRGRMVYVMSTHFEVRYPDADDGGTVQPSTRVHSNDDDEHSDGTETPQRQQQRGSRDRIRPVQLFWDALSGEHYPVNDTLCPLRRADIAFNESNIWANMQTHELSASSLDLSKTANWKPFFDKKYPKLNLASVQVDQLLYEDPVVVYKEEIETMLTTKLQASFSGWRPRHVTRWNRHCSKVLKTTLADFEEAWITTDEATSPAKTRVLEALHELSQSYNIVGIPLNFPFTTYSDAANRIHNTNMHCIEDKHVEYALAVHVHAYPNKIFSVWVYVASVQQPRT